MTRNLESRIAKLEQFSKPPRRYVFHVSDPPTKEEDAAIAGASGPIVIVPHPCKTVEEWIAKHSPRETLQ
jgi:hypothetical protein